MNSHVFNSQYEYVENLFRHLAFWLWITVTCGLLMTWLHDNTQSAMASAAGIIFTARVRTFNFNKQQTTPSLAWSIKDLSFSVGYHYRLLLTTGGLLSNSWEFLCQPSELGHAPGEFSRSTRDQRDIRDTASNTPVCWVFLRSFSRDSK